MTNIALNLEHTINVDPKERTSFDVGDESLAPYTLQKAEHDDTFCSATISWKNTVLRYFQTFSCLFTAGCLFLAPYLYFFSESRVINHIITVADMIYLLVMVFRSRTSHMKDGVEEQNLLKVRDRYQGSVAFVLDVITYFPLIQQQLPIIQDYEEYYILNRQTMVIRLHYILHYLGK